MRLGTTAPVSRYLGPPSIDVRRDLRGCGRCAPGPLRTILVGTLRYRTNEEHTIEEQPDGDHQQDSQSAAGRAAAHLRYCASRHSVSELDILRQQRSHDQSRYQNLASNTTRIDNDRGTFGVGDERASRPHEPGKYSTDDAGECPDDDRDTPDSDAR
jgi:hypothetical protein